MTKTAEYAHVVLPAAATWCEGEGTVTNSERRVQRVRKVTDPPAGARDELWILSEIARRLGHDWATPTAEEVWNEFRVVAPQFAGGMSYAARIIGRYTVAVSRPSRIRARHSSTAASGRFPRRGRAAPFSVVDHDPPVEQADDDYPFVLTTGRRLESYNTGVQTSGYASPLHNGGTLDISPEDAARLRIADGDLVRIESRRGRVEAPARIDEALRAGMVFMTMHFPDDVPTNLLTIDVSDPKSGTAEFEACAVRVEPITVPANPFVRATADVSAKGAH